MCAFVLFFLVLLFACFIKRSENSESIHLTCCIGKDGKEDNIFTPARRQHLSKEDYSYRLVDATFLPSHQAVVTLDNIKPSKNPYLIIPATYGRDKAGAFTLEVTSNVEIFLVECN